MQISNDHEHLERGVSGTADDLYLVFSSLHQPRLRTAGRNTPVNHFRGITIGTGALYLTDENRFLDVFIVTA